MKHTTTWVKLRYNEKKFMCFREVRYTFYVLLCENKTLKNIKLMLLFLCSKNNSDC